MKKQEFTVLKIADLHPFPDNPFHMAADETLTELAESIKEFGMVRNTTGCCLIRRQGQILSCRISM